jgi:hypothetical protein
MSYCNRVASVVRRRRLSTINENRISSLISRWISVPIVLLARSNYWAQNLVVCLLKFDFVNKLLTTLFIFEKFHENSISSLISPWIIILIAWMDTYNCWEQNLVVFW